MIPIEERYLMLEGKFDRQWIETAIHQSITKGWPVKDAPRTRMLEYLQAVQAYQTMRVPDTSVYCAVSFAYDQIPVGKTFDMVFPIHQPKNAIKSPSVLLAVFFEFYPMPDPFIGKGYRSVCLLDFPSGAPLLIQNLPTKRHFMEAPFSKIVCIASEETVSLLLTDDYPGKSTQP